MEVWGPEVGQILGTPPRIGFPCGLHGEVLWGEVERKSTAPGQECAQGTIPTSWHRTASVIVQSASDTVITTT